MDQPWDRADHLGEAAVFDRGGAGRDRGTADKRRSHVEAVETELERLRRGVDGLRGLHDSLAQFRR